MKAVYLAVLAMSLLFCVTCCTPKSSVEQNKISQEEMREHMIQQNRNVLEAERNSIKAFTDSSDQVFSSSGSGLLYTALTLSKHKDNIQEGDLITIEYEIKDLHNNLLESSEFEGTKQIRYLRDNEILGLHEGLALMHLNDEYLFIVPAHLGFGLGGEGNIPARATLLYKVKIVSIN